MQDGPIFKSYVWINPATGLPAVGPRQDQWIFLSAKDPGSYTLNISASVWVYSPQGKTSTTLTDSLTIIVESPSVTFEVDGFGATQFRRMDADQNFGAFEYLGFSAKSFVIANMQPGFVFDATVNNTTHYRIRAGYMQEVKTDRAHKWLNRQEVRINPPDDLIDGVTQTDTALWYANELDNGYWDIDSKH